MSPITTRSEIKMNPIYDLTKEAITQMFSPSTHSRGLHVSTALPAARSVHLSQIIDNSTCDDLNNLCTRIGSMSEDARVYKCFVENTPIAVKIENLGYTQIPEDHSLEYDFSKFLSDNNPEHFIRMLGHKYCPFEYNGQVLYRSTIYMELVAGDLHQVIADGITSETLDKYVEDVFLANIALSFSGYVHGDMHLGNIFIRDTGDGTQAILGDFGKFKEAEFNTSQLEDMTKFFTALKAKTENIPYLRRINQKVATYYRILSTKLENYSEDLPPDEVLTDVLNDWQRIPL